VAVVEGSLVREIRLTHGFIALVDDEDWECLSRFRWHVTIRHGNAYAATNKKRPLRGTWTMHRLIMDAPPGVFIDHVRHRPLSDRVVDNRRENLRVATNGQNCANQKKKAGKTSMFKGVSLRPEGKWCAQIMKDGRAKHLGLFPTEALAARRHDLAAVEHFGDFALTNFPVPGSRQWIFGASHA
jgi:hypothetical protein